MNDNTADVRPPVRAHHDFVQHLPAPPEEVFPLLCPVREREWVRGWDPRVVFSTSGVVEEGCVFVTPGEVDEAVWYVTRHDPTRFVLSFVKTEAVRLVTAIDIRLESEGESGTAAHIRYAKTAVSAEGEADVAAFTALAYEKMMKGWEEAITFFLQTGEMTTE